MVETDIREIVRIIGYGFLTWLIPFIIAIPFYSPDGKILVDPFLFKSIMVVTGAVVGAFLIIRLFKPLTRRYLNQGIRIGIVWLCINWMMDLLILIPMSGLDIPSYFNQIGLRYLLIPIMTIMAGIIAQNAKTPELY